MRTDTPLLIRGISDLFTVASLYIINNRLKNPQIEPVKDVNVKDVNVKDVKDVNVKDVNVKDVNVIDVEPVDIDQIDVILS
jgi:hypothetical protein